MAAQCIDSIKSNSVKHHAQIIQGGKGSSITNTAYSGTYVRSCEIKNITLVCRLSVCTPVRI